MEESPEPDISNTSVGILTIVNSTSPTHFSPVSAAAVVEDELVVGDKWADAFVLLFGLFYVLHLDYPKNLVNTFIQKLLTGLEDGKQLKPCLLRLKNNLLLPE
uniref:Uncharacterized protein n=1 Tax=Pundamilia nyererei TaxID=303518 RepID=A0A3B4EVT4_9CICH